MRKPWTQEDDARLVELRQSGFTVGQIGGELGRSRGSVSSRMMALGMFGKSANRPWGAWEIEHLIDHYRHYDWPVKRLADHYGRTPSAVRMKAAYLGIQRPEIDYKRKPDDVDRRIVTLAMADVPSDEIGEQVGCSVAYVSLVMQKRPHMHRRWKERLGMRRRRSEYHQKGRSHG